PSAARRGGKSGSGSALTSNGAGSVASGGTTGILVMSPGTLMLGPGSGPCALFGTDGSGPNTRPGSGAGAQGGPMEDAAALAAALADFGAGVMAGRNGSA